MLYHRLCEIIAIQVEDESPIRGEIKVDERNFGGTRKWKRGFGAADQVLCSALALPRQSQPDPNASPTFAANCMHRGVIDQTRVQKSALLWIKGNAR